MYEPNGFLMEVLVTEETQWSTVKIFRFGSSEKIRTDFWKQKYAAEAEE